MNRLQVGDECYVRYLQTGEIFACTYRDSMFGRLGHYAVPIKKNTAFLAFNISNNSNNHLVYPFPCVKELAQ